MKDSFVLNFSTVSGGTGKSEMIFYDSINEILDCIDGQIIVTDCNVAKIPKVKEFLKKSQKKKTAIVILRSGEKSKTLKNACRIIKTALKKGYTKKATFVALGGGVVSDITGLAAHLYKRGANFQIIPTTLLSMCDACIGGKTGCNFENYKNMIGTFYPAEKIHFSVEFLETLKKFDFFSGLGEVIKTAMLYDKNLFENLKTKSEEIQKKDKTVIFQIVKQCASAKSKIVEQDIGEKNIRKQLNLGHTFAHALESVAGFGKIPHGTAVAWGLSRAIELSFNLNLCTEEYKDNVIQLLSLYDYPTTPIPKILATKKLKKDTVQKKLLGAMKQDKKNESNSICCVLQKELNSTIIQDVSENDILKVL
ncbi:MAG: 3-dehydroquinate synthase [Treponemataceae bacterium]